MAARSWRGLLGQRRWSVSRRTVAGTIALALALSACSWFGDTNPVIAGWLAPLWPDGPASVSEICDDSACVAEAVVLPSLRPVESVVDLPMPETLGALTLERLWTGERRGLFGAGWETVWDAQLANGTITGALPAAPVGAPMPGEPVALTDGSTVRFDEGGRLTEVCLDSSYCVEATWADDQLVLQTSSAGQTEVRLSLDEGRVVSSESSDGRRVAYRYTDGLLAEVDSSDRVVRYGYDDGKLTAIDDGSQRSFTYDESDRVSTFVDRDGATWTFAGAQSVIGVGTPDETLRTYRYSDGLLMDVEDDELGVLLQRQIVDGAVQEEQRPLDGLVIRRQPDGSIEVVEAQPGVPDRRVVATLDSLGRPAEITSADGVTTIRYDGLSRRPIVVSRGGHDTAFTYDAQGLLLSTRDADGYEVTVERDIAGLPTQVSDGVLSTSFEYDAAGRTIVESSGDWSASADYRSDGLLGAMTTRSGQELEADYDDAGRLRALGSEPADLLDVAAVPDEDETAPGPTDPGLDSADVTALETGREYRYDSGESAVYDEWGRLVSLTVDDRTTRRAYDDQGRLRELVQPEGTTYDVTYTPAGRIATIDDGMVTGTFSWHGDLLTSVSTSAGTTISYAYESDGQLVSTTLGPTRWTYRYDDAGLLASVERPTGSARYEWDDRARPTSIVDGNRASEITWTGDDYDLESVVSSESEVRIGRDSQGNVVEVEIDDETSRFDYNTSGQIESYELSSGVSATLTYLDGLPVELDSSGRIEQWAWDDGLVAAVTIDEERFELDWAAPGILSGVRHDDRNLLATDADERGRPLEIRNEDDESIASFDWSSAGVTTASLDEAEVALGYDDEWRVTDLALQDSSYSWTYQQGTLLSTSADDTSTSFSYADGRLSQARVVNGDNWANVTWDDGRPDSFRTSEGEGSFTYRGEHIGAIAYDDHVRQVTYDEDGSPSAEATGGDFLKDLFDERGRFLPPVAAPLDTPHVPWLERLPIELGIELPDVVSAEDIVEQALADATPDVPLPLRPDDRIAERTAEAMFALVLPSSLPVAADRMASVSITPDSARLDELLSSSAPILVANSVFDRLADGPCLLCRIVNAGVDAGVGVGLAIAGVGRSVYGFIVDTPAGRAALEVAYMVVTELAYKACAGSGAVCLVVVMAAEAALTAAINAPRDGVRTAIANATIRPIREFVSGLVHLEPAAYLDAAQTLMHIWSRFRGSRGLTTAVARSLVPVCSSRRVLCISASRFGAAADHVADAQRGGAPRLLQLDRAGAAARRTSALRNLPSVVGFDRDEYPFAISSRRAGLSIRYIDPASNRSLGAYLGQQLSGLPDGARFFVLPIR